MGKPIRTFSLFFPFTLLSTYSREKAQNNLLGEMGTLKKVLESRKLTYVGTRIRVMKNHGLRIDMSGVESEKT